MRLVVTGASGELGRRAAELLLATAPDHDLILVTRNPGALAALSRRGADVRAGDFDDPTSLRRAFAGGERMLLISTTELARRGTQHENAVAAAATAGIAHVVYTSALAPAPPNPAVVAPSHHLTEEILRASDLGWTILRNSLYAEYQAPEAAAALASGRLVHNRGTGRIAYVAREDCAAVAAAVLAAGGHTSRIYDVTGPKSYSAAELAELYGALAGCCVEPVALDDAAFVDTLAVSLGQGDHARYGAELVASFGRAIREGYFASCTRTVELLTGQRATTLEQVLERSRDACA